MKNVRHLLAMLAGACLSAAVWAEADVSRGARVFRACVACHSVVAGDHRTGPSLASVFGRKAGSVAGFQRYSDALRNADVTWSEKSLDAWLRDPAEFIPDNGMAFRGLSDAGARGDLIAYLRAVSEGEAPAPKGASLPDLKTAGPDARVSAIRHCGDTYRVALGNGKDHLFWEFNLRFKTDSSLRGPRKGEPVILGTGMGGDRAQVVFAAPEEISAFIRNECE